MKIDNIKLLSGENSFQKAEIEPNEKTIDYETSQNLSYIDLISINKGLCVLSEFFDVNAAVSVSGAGICAVALDKTLEDALLKVMDSNPIDFMSSIILVSGEVDSEVARKLKDTNKIVATSFTKNAKEILEAHNVCYVTINTPLKDYKKFLSNDIKVTPLGTLTQTPNLSDLQKDTFKIESTTKPTVEQIEDAVFAWKVAKHINSQAVVIVKDLKTTAISQALHKATVEFALDYSCDTSKEAVLASDMPITVHDVNVAAQGRISVLILPSASKEIVELVNKYGMVLITTGFMNVLF